MLPYMISLEAQMVGISLLHHFNLRCIVSHCRCICGTEGSFDIGLQSLLPLLELQPLATPLVSVYMSSTSDTIGNHVTIIDALLVVGVPCLKDFACTSKQLAIAWQWRIYADDAE